MAFKYSRAVALLLFTGCGGASEDDASTAEELSRGQYENPLLDGAYCGAPNVRKVGDSYALVCASAGIGAAKDAYHVRTSRDLVHWSAPHTVFDPGSHPRWAKAPGVGHYWCPEIYKVDGKWVLLFAASKPTSGGGEAMAIGSAVADAPEGPWRAGEAPLVAQGDHSIVGPADATSGRIDPTLLFDEKTGEVYRDAAGHMYMYYVYQPRHVRVVKLASDGHGHLSIVRGTDHALMLASGQSFTTTLPWEETVVEGVEAQVRANGKIYLLYSGASAWDASYATGAAQADHPEGPFHKRAQPILSTGGGKLVGPGHGSQWVIGPDGKPYLPYRVQLRDHTGHGGAQLLAIEPLRFDAEGWPRVLGGDHPHAGPHADP